MKLALMRCEKDTIISQQVLKKSNIHKSKHCVRTGTQISSTLFNSQIQWSVSVNVFSGIQIRLRKIASDISTNIRFKKWENSGTLGTSDAFEPLSRHDWGN